MITLKALVMNILFIALLYFGLVQGDEQIGNLALFFAWGVIVVGFTMLHDSAQETCKEAIRERGRARSLPVWLNVTFSIVAVVLLVWTGWFITAAFFTMAETLSQATLAEIEKEMADEK